MRLAHTPTPHRNATSKPSAVPELDSDEAFSAQHDAAIPGPDRSQRVERVVPMKPSVCPIERLLRVGMVSGSPGQQSTLPTGRLQAGHLGLIAAENARLASAPAAMCVSAQKVRRCHRNARRHCRRPSCTATKFLPQTHEAPSSLSSTTPGAATLGAPRPQHRVPESCLWVSPLQCKRAANPS